VYFLILSSVFTVAIAAGLDRTRTDLGSYLVPIILLIAVPSSAILTSFTLNSKRENEGCDDDRTKKGKTGGVGGEGGGENFLKSSLSLLGKCDRIDVDIVQNQNMYVPSVPLPKFSPAIIDEKYCSRITQRKVEKDNENNKECKTVKNINNVGNIENINGMEGIKNMMNMRDVREGKGLNSYDELTTQAGNLCPSGLGINEDIASNPDMNDFLSISINGREECDNISNQNESQQDDNNNENTIEIDLIPLNSTLPLTSTWPDYPLLVRRAPSSSSREVAQSRDKYLEYIKPIKIHSNVNAEAMRAIGESSYG
jgi:hypothetical protein